MKTANELRRERAALVGEYRGILETADTRGGARTDAERERTNVLKGEIERLDGEIEEREDLDAYEKSFEQPVTRQQRPAGSRSAPPSQRTKDDLTSIYLRHVRTADWGALNEYRQAQAEAQREERASNNTGMNITTAADGGDLVPVGHVNKILERREESMLRDKLGVQMVAGVGTTVNHPIDNEADGEFITKGEMGDDNTTNAFDRDAPAVTKVAMTLVKYTKKIELTDELLADNDSNLLQFIENFVGRGMGKTHNELLVTEALAGGTAGTTFASASTIAAGEVPALYYALPDPYAEDDQSVAWLMRRATEGVIRGLAGTTNFYYAPTPGGGIGPQPILWGEPLYKSAKVPAIAASAKSVILGNWYYMLNREAPGLTFLRDPYTVDGKVILKYYFRTVYKVGQAAAIVYGTHST